MSQNWTENRKNLDSPQRNLNSEFEKLYKKNYSTSSQTSTKFKKEYQFYFSEQYHNFLSQRKLDLDIDWKYIRLIKFRTLEHICCPICMSESNELLLPRILRCHHIYCLPCILTQYIDVRETCPVCNQVFSIQDLKNVKIKQFNPIVGQTLKMILMQKHPNTFKVDFYENFQKNNFLEKIKFLNDYRYEKILLADLEISSQNHCNDQIIINFLEFIAVKRLSEFENKNENIIKDLRIPKKNSLQKPKKLSQVEMIYFYQEHNGFNVFLDPIDFKFLALKKSQVELMEKEIEINIKEFEYQSKNLKQLKQNQTFAHVGSDNKYLIIRIDMTKILNYQLLKEYNQEIYKRKKIQENKEKKNEENKNFQTDYEIAQQLFLQEQALIQTDEHPELFDERDHEDNYDSHYPEFETKDLYSSRMRNLIGEQSIKTKMKKKKEKKIKEQQEVENQQEEIPSIIVIKKKKKKKRQIIK